MLYRYMMIYVYIELLFFWWCFWQPQFASKFCFPTVNLLRSALDLIILFFANTGIEPEQIYNPEIERRLAEIENEKYWKATNICKDEQIRHVYRRTVPALSHTVHLPRLQRRIAIDLPIL